jgi:hypothetical protein
LVLVLEFAFFDILGRLVTCPLLRVDCCAEAKREEEEEEEDDDEEADGRGAKMRGWCIASMLSIFNGGVSNLRGSREAGSKRRVQAADG